MKKIFALLLTALLVLSLSAVAFAADKPAHFDFWAMSRRQLLDAGLRPERVALAGVCTRCSAEYFSFRRAKQESGGLCGRHGSLIALPPG